MRTIGIILLIIGIIGTLIFGIQALSESEAVNILGLKIGVSTAQWTPVIVSVVILIIGIVMSSSRRTKSDLV